MKKLTLLLSLYILTITAVLGQTRISVEDFSTRSTFAEKKITGINWMNDGKYYTTLTDNKITKYDITTGQPVHTLVDGAALQPQLIIEDYSFSADERKLLLQTEKQSIYRRSFIARYFVYDLGTRTVSPLSSTGRESYATFLPMAAKWPLSGTTTFST